MYSCFSGFRLAYYCNKEEVLEVDILIGSDYYWSLVTWATPSEECKVELKKIWDLESLGVRSPSVYEEFLEKLSYRGDHHDVNLPWNATHPPLPDNYELSGRRLRSLWSRLRMEPEVLREYDGVIRDQIQRGIVDVEWREMPVQGQMVSITFLIMPSSYETS
ncbi:uncharacterized protein [Montipora foliosa]|uniref:uncharacterized protein n=1 Tax=Montipora foliosa TaxID=591990 RepID=UPI0035F1A31F